MFVGVEFDDDRGSVALVHSTWLTPRKGEVYWPPYKTQYRFNKALLKSEPPEETWELFSVKKRFFECDEFNAAQRKLKLAEATSDIQSDTTTETHKRKIKRPTRLYDSTDSDEIENTCKKQRLLQRPPLITSVDELCYNADLSVDCANDQRPRTSQTIIQSNRNGDLSVDSANEYPPTSQTIIQSYRNTDLSVDCANDQHPQTSQTIIQTNRNADLSVDSANEYPLTSQTIVQSNRSTPSTDRKYHLSRVRSAPAANDDILYKILDLLVSVKEQNAQILRFVEKQINPISGELPKNLPTNLPVGNDYELMKLNSYLDNENNIDALVSYFSTLGGREITSKTNKILRKCMTDGLASEYSFFGKKKKKSFAELKLRDAVVRGVKTKEPQATEAGIENCIKDWLKHAPQRVCLSLTREWSLYEILSHTFEEFAITPL